MEAETKERAPQLMICTGCGHHSDEPISSPHLACCPDSNYVPAVAHVYQMNDCDWMAAYSLDEAKAEYLQNYCGNTDAAEAFDNPSEVSAEDMARLKFHDTDVQPEVVRTFQQQLDLMVAEGQKFPCFFASTEY